MEDKSISLQTLRRLPVYLHYLKHIREEYTSVSATFIADKLGLNNVQVRKDLAAVSGSGRPKTGYFTDELILQIEKYLGCESGTKAVLVGTRNLGKALVSYGGFADYGIDVICAFDNDPEVYGKSIGTKPILPVEKMDEFFGKEQVKLGIITVPMAQAQGVCDKLVELGIKAIWNFAPTIVRVPQGVVAENENLASSLAVLSKHLQNIDI